MRSRDHPSTFCASAGLSVNIRQISVLPRDLLQLSMRHAFPSSNSINFCQNYVSMRPSENILCGHWTFRQLLSTFCTSEGQSINYLCICGTFRQPPSTSAGHSVNFLCIRGTFHQLSVRPQKFCQLPPTFRAPAGPSVNISYGSGIFRPLLSIFCASVGHSVKFLCVRGTFHQLFVLKRDLPSISINFRASAGLSINFLCVRGTFHQLLSTF